MNSVSFSEQIDAYVSLIELSPVEYLYMDGETYIIDAEGNISNINGGYTGEMQNPLVNFIVNQDYQQTKTFDVAEFFFSDSNSTGVEQAFFTASKQRSIIIDNTTFDLREATHKLSIPRAGAGLFADRMRDKYLSCTYRMTRSADNSYYFSLPYIKTKYRYSSI